MNWRDFFLYLLTMAGVTYLLRTIPFILLRKQLKSEFWNSFLSGGFSSLTRLRFVV
ncbi:branched-subunit amino acid transport protein AzlD [Fibrobacter sp. UWS1]|nr:branched-subunit amino acid transport protein AzlD [Fibrobacter sp. UWS1]